MKQKPARRWDKTVKNRYKYQIIEENKIKESRKSGIRASTPQKKESIVAAENDQQIENKQESTEENTTEDLKRPFGNSTIFEHAREPEIIIDLEPDTVPELPMCDTI